MFKSCCSRPNKKENKDKNSKTKTTETFMDDKISQTEDRILTEDISDIKERSNSSDLSQISHKNSTMNTVQESKEGEDSKCRNLSSTSTADIAEDAKSITPQEDGPSEQEFKQLSLLNELYMKKRFSVDYKRNKTDFKRYSVDLRPSTATLAELDLLEQQLARTNVDVKPGIRRKSSGILKSTTDTSFEVDHQRHKLEICSDDDDVFEPSSAQSDGVDGAKEPPATPVGRDELALRRHRFFSNLVCAARAAVEHRVRFDPLGPAVVADAGNDNEPVEVAQCPASELEALIERLERVTSRLEKLPLLLEDPPSPNQPRPTPAPAAETVFLDTDNMSVNGYQDLVQGPLRNYLTLSQQIGGDVATHANLVNAAFQAQMSYIQFAASRSKPAQHEEGSLLAPTSEKINAIQQFREKNRTSQYFNHLSAISESIPALGWVAISPTPAPYVKEMNDAGQFYTNRVLKDWKEKDKRHADWCRAWVQLLADLQAYVKQFHTTGLVWSGKGGAAPPPPPGGLPPPPPVLPDVDFSGLSLDDRSALFAQINQGEGITSNLRKVTSDMQTHKNPTLRSGPAPFKAAPPAPAPAAPHRPLPAPGAGPLDKPPVFTRDGKKWLIEYQKGNQNLVVEKADMNNVVYMYRCRESALTVRGKINGVVLDSCTKCAVVFDNLVSSVEFVNCQSVQMQVLGKVPTISIDKTDGCQMYLSPESLDVEVVSSKSSEMNVLIPAGNGDYTEHPVPEQFKSIYKKGHGVVTTPVESTG